MAYVVQQIVKTTAGWAEFDALGKPMPKNYWLFEQVTETSEDVTKKYYKFKISDGVNLYADLPYQLLNGHSASINEAGNWLVYDDATQTYKDSGAKAIGVDGKSAFELWQALEGNADKTLDDYFAAQKGDKGDPFKYTDFTEEQITDITGKSAYEVWKAQPGNEDKTVEEYLAAIKGDPFKYTDFTEEQITKITGKSAYEVWKEQPGNEDKTVEEYLIAIKGQDGQSAYLDAVAKGYTGTKDEFDTLLAGIGYSGMYKLPFELLSLSEISTSEEIAAAIRGVEGYNEIVQSISKQNLLYFEDNRDGIYKTFVTTYSHMIGDNEGITLEAIGDTAYICIVMSKSVNDIFSFRKMIVMLIEDQQRLEKALVTTDIATLTFLSTLSPVKYSQKFTYTSATAQGINFASTPAEGFECVVAILNNTASSITQPLPNATEWVSDGAINIPAGKVAEISIKYIFSKYLVKSIAI